jgi:hypothetical protein
MLLLTFSRPQAMSRAHNVSPSRWPISRTMTTFLGLSSAPRLAPGSTPMASIPNSNQHRDTIPSHIACPFLPLSSIRSSSCGTHTSQAPTWTSPISCECLRHGAAHCKLQARQQRRYAIGSAGDAANSFQSHGELRRCGVCCSRRCRQVVPVQRFVSCAALP